MSSMPTPSPADDRSHDAEGDASASCEWSARWSRPSPRTGARSISNQVEGCIHLPAPAQPWFIELECRVGGIVPAPIRVIVRNRDVGRAPEYGPYLDVGVKLTPRRWHRLAFPVTLVPQPGEMLEVSVAFDPIPPPTLWTAQRLRLPRWLSVRNVAVRGEQATARDVVIIVLNWRRPDETIRCLESLGRADLGGARVLVVDNGSDDQSVERIRSAFPHQRILALPQNSGYAGGNNAGIQAALADGARAVLLLNNDTEVAPDFLSPLLWALNSDPHVAAVSSAILRMDHRELLDVAYLSLYWGHGIVRHHGVNALPGEGFKVRCDVDVAVGCSVLMSAEALRHLGPLKEEYFAYHEEVDWCTRARADGFRILYQPLSRVWHGGSKSTDHLAEPLSAARTVVSGPQLPMPIALTWNPVRTYLGARNTVRFVRLNGSLTQRAYFWLHSAYAVPLEALAAIMRQEPALKIGAWSYRRALHIYAGSDRGPSPTPPGIGAAELLALPRILLWTLPRDIRMAHREGRLAQILELLRGLRDGALERPLPLERLGLR